MYCDRVDELLLGRRCKMMTWAQACILNSASVSDHRPQSGEEKMEEYVYEMELGMGIGMGMGLGMMNYC